MAKDPEINVAEADLVFFDTETTGFDLGKELIEIGLVKVKAKTFEVIAEKDIKMKPVHIETADPDALKIVGYDQAEWDRDGVDLKAGLEEFLSYTESAILVGHNIAFDWMHVRKSLEQCGLRPNYYYKGLDTFSLAWQKLAGHKDIQRISLSELTRYFNIPEGRKHRAIDDAKSTYQVFLKLLAEPEHRAF
ncbi:MAG TPA: 3'-5' exonuclease [Candidatus Paceibacterota bacterium]|nr:3'-5' exonuclease [Candidatus Paceibacterota bacterium]